MDEANSERLDLTSHKLKKLLKPSGKESLVSELIVDDNELQRFDNIDNFTRLTNLSAAKNRLSRMYGIFRILSLQILNLEDNTIVNIEGLKDLVHLKFLNLSGNNIKTIEHLNNNIKLEHLDLSRNNITQVADLSFLRNLKVLHLHKNRLVHLRNCDRFMPVSLCTLTLAGNQLTDLNELSQLSHLASLRSISLAENPCVSMTMTESSQTGNSSNNNSNKIGFDYRPFVINWCVQVQVIDGYAVDAIESLRGEWLYSQGRGRHFRVGEQEALVQYLATVCPLSAAQPLETEEDRKLRLILSKAQHHQQQLRDQSTSGTPVGGTTSTRSRLNTASKISSPRLARASSITASSSSRTRSPSTTYTPTNPEATVTHLMTASCFTTTSSDPPLPSSSTNGQDVLPTLNGTPLMTRSLDPSVLAQVTMTTTRGVGDSVGGGGDVSCQASSYGLLQALSKLVPVPESLMSPDYVPTPSALHTAMATITAAQANNSESSSTIPTVVSSPRLPRSNIAVRRKPTITNKLDTNKISINKIIVNHEETNGDNSSKLRTIQKLADEKRSKEHAAIYIQKMWRGFHARNRNQTVADVVNTVQTQRTQETITRLSEDLDTTKSMLESEHRIQVLQMQAINALWKKVSNLPSTTDLTKTCASLSTQVAQLQVSMEDMMRVMSAFLPQSGDATLVPSTAATAVQTDIIAVQTPDAPPNGTCTCRNGTNFTLFPHPLLRPCTLPLVTPVTTTANTPPSTSTSSDLSQGSQIADTLLEAVISTQHPINNQSQVVASTSAANN